MIREHCATARSHHSLINIMASLTNGFLKFLTRFSGRRRLSLRRNQQLNQRSSSTSSHYFNLCKLSLAIPVVLLLLLSTIIDVTDACNSRTVPRPRTTPSPQQTTTTPRPNVTFQTFKCPPEYADWYCLNKATCFTVKIGQEVLYNCECRDGYIGPRCDYKDLDGSYLAGRPRVMLETASIAGGAVAALFLSTVVGLFVYVRWHQSKKREDEEEESALQSPQNGNSNGHTNAAADVVDGPSNRAPQPCYCQKSQVQYSNQLSSNATNATNGDSSELQHPQQQQFQAVPHYHRTLRPFGPHHYHSLSMETAIEKSLEPKSVQTRL